MAGINDFKIVSQKSLKYYNLICKEFNILNSTKFTEKQKEIFGFYPFMLEYLTDKRDLSDIIDIITDADFNKELFSSTFDDCGIDAVNIDDEKNLIQLFNFKYCEKFKVSSVSINSAIVSTKFINALIQENTTSLIGKIKQKAEDIIERYQTNEVWKMQLFIVSNESFDTNPNFTDLDNLKNTYNLEIIVVDLNKISEFITLRPEPVSASLILEKDAVMTFSESSLTSSKSYMIRLPLYEVIRITCNNDILRKKYNIENLNELNKVGLDYSVLFDNVRGFVTKSKFNDNILKTLQNEPNRFFVYNNGLTLTAKDINAEEVNGNKKVLLSLEGIQVLNGGQTLRTIHEFNEENNENIKNNLVNAQILLRIFKITSGLNNEIAEYTNSQNAISSIDLRSLRDEQLKLEQFLDTKNIIYSRKSGDTGIKESKNYDYKISMEKFGQILFSIRGYPDKASNQKNAIFEKYYDEVFGNKLDIDKAPQYIRRYFEIKQFYQNNTQNITEQKIFFLLYLDNLVTDFNLSEAVPKFEGLISEYRKGEDVTLARKLIQKDFKVEVDKLFNIQNKNESIK